jgi:hypothetical protein
LGGGGQAADLGGSIESVLLGPIEARSANGSSFILGGARGLSRTGSRGSLRSAGLWSSSSLGLRERAGGGSSGGGGGGEDDVLRRRGAELRAVR